MNAIRQTQSLNARELELVTDPKASWHRDYDDTAFIYVGGLDTGLSEGDVLTIFSQYGEPVFINLVRDKETGKSKGFCFLKYEDQRSCWLAVDNLGGAEVLGRKLRVDHTRYKAKEGEEIFDNTHGEEAPNGNGRAAETESESEDEPARPLLKEEIELRKLLADEEDDDPMRQFMIEQKREEVAAAKAKQERKEKKQNRHRSHRDRDEKDRSTRHRDEDRDRRERKRRDRSRSEDGGRKERRRRDRSEEDERKRERRRSRSPRKERHERASRRDRSPSKTPTYDD